MKINEDGVAIVRGHDEYGWVRGQGFGSNSGQNSGTDQKLKGEDKYG